MKHRLALAIITLLCTLAVSVTAQESQWSLTKGDNTIEASTANIHVKQRDPKDTNAFALARKPLHLVGTSWRVAFDVRYGELQPVGSTVKLGVGDRLIGAVGGDAKGINVYLGNDTVNFLQPTDAEWHHFEFVCDGTTSSVWHNGVKISEEPTQGKPDTLIVGAWSEGKWLSGQTELWLRNLDTAIAQAPLHWQSSTSLLPSQTLNPVLDFTTGFDTASIVRETDTPQHSASQTLTTAKLDGQTTNALHVLLSDLADHDTLRAPDYSISPASSDDAKTILWARGDIHTPKLMVEWDERDGTRWIATFPITEQWQRIVLSPKDFAPWLVAADRARLGFHPSQAMSFRMGLDVSNTHTAPGPHEYWVAQIGIEAPPPAITPVASVVPLPALSSDAVTIPLRPTDTDVTCQVGDRLQISGSVTMQNTFDTCLLLADGSVAATRTPSIPTDNYSFTWTPKTPGMHSLELRYTTLHAKVTVRRLLITAADSPPAVLLGPSASVAVDTTVSVVGAGSRPFPLARVDFYFNDKPLAVATTAPFAATLPIETITQPGTHPVKFVAYDGSGRPFYAHASKIGVPQRVQVTAPRTFTLRTAGDKVNLTASVLPGIKVAKVSFSIVHADASHYETLADVTAAPYSAEVDLSNRASGDYLVRAVATSVAGNSYEAWAAQLTLNNMPDNARKVQEAKDKAAAEAKAAAVAVENAKRQAAIDARDDSNAGLAETQKWICDTISKSAGTSYRDGTDEQRYANAYFDGNDLVFSNTATFYSLIDYDDYEVPMEEMDERRVVVSKIDAATDNDNLSYRVGILSSGDAPVVSTRYRIWTSSTPDLPSKQEHVARCDICFRDKAMAERFAKAIKHAIILCKANHLKEPF